MYSGNPIEDYIDYCHDEEQALKRSGHWCTACGDKFIAGRGGMYEKETRTEFCGFCYNNFQHVYYLRDRLFNEGLRLRDVLATINNMTEI